MSTASLTPYLSTVISLRASLPGGQGKSNEGQRVSVTTRSVDKAGVIAAIVGSFSCAACFPAAASIGAAIGLGFLSQWESLFVHILIPIFAIAVLLANLTGWFTHREWHRTVLGSVGPVMALIGAFGLMGVFGMTHGFLAPNIARAVFYAGLIVMLLAAAGDLARPARRCALSRSARQPSAPSKSCDSGHRVARDHGACAHHSHSPFTPTN
ncbi:MAG TPA: organomercurial transporter MerC [Rhodanobacteraceae bacterium]